MANRRATVYLCDTPICGVMRIAARDDDRDVIGFVGTIREVSDAGRVEGGEWFACKAEHVNSSIHAVLARAWEGRDSDG